MLRVTIDPNVFVSAVITPDGEQAQTLIDGILGVAELRNDPPPSDTGIRDPNDAYLCALADAEQADVLVSGDRDLFAANLVSAGVLTPRAFLDELRA